MDLETQGVVDDLEGDGGGETVIITYCMKLTLLQ